MKNRTGRSFFFAAILGVAVVCHTVEGAPEELTKLQQQFALEKGLLNQKIRSLDENYIAALKRLEESEREAGKLNSVLEIRKEIEQHSAPDGSDPAKLQARLSEEPGLRNMQTTYLDARSKIDLEITATTKLLLKKHHERLSELGSDLTKAARIEEAIIVKNEIDRIAALIAVEDAEEKDESEMPATDPVRVRAHLVAKAEAELFHNGESVYLRRNDDPTDNGIDSKSTFFEVKPGDTIVVRVNGIAVYRSLALAFELPDEDRNIFFAPGDFKVFENGRDIDAAEVDATMIKEAPAVHPEPTVPDRYWVDKWSEHRLDGGGFLKPEPQGEWAVWGAVLTKGMLERGAK